MDKCKHENTEQIGGDKYQDYEIMSEKSRKFNVAAHEIHLCRDCGNLIDFYHSEIPMTNKEITDWIDALIEIQRSKIIQFVEAL